MATLLGLALALAWPSGLVFVAVWLLALAATRFSSVAGIGAALSTPISAALFGRFDLVLLLFGFTLIVLWKHRGNLERLLDGTEPRIGVTRGADARP